MELVSMLLLILVGLSVPVVWALILRNKTMPKENRYLWCVMAVFFAPMVPVYGLTRGSPAWNIYSISFIVIVIAYIIIHGMPV